MTRPIHPCIVLGLLLLSACAPKTAPTAVAPPRYPSFIYPGVPGALAGQKAFADRHQSGWRLLQAGDLRGAERDFRWVTGQAPTFFPSEVGLGYVLLARRDYREALEHFELGLVVAPNYPAGLVGRGEALVGLGRQAEALVNFEAAIAADPSLTDLRSRVESMRFRNLEEQVAAARRARDAGRYDDAAVAYQRALAASPESGFLHRELAGVEQRLGRHNEALAHARRALELDPSDVRAYVLAAEMYEAQGQFVAAVAEYEKAASIEPGPELNARLEAARERAALAELPEEYRAIESDPAITRAQLAALIGVRLDDVMQQAPQRSTPVMTDTRGHWAARWITAVVRAGVMDPFPNHAFQPAAIVRRGELAVALSRLLGLAGGRDRDRKRIEDWRAARPQFDDLPPTHLTYPAAAMAVGAGVLDRLEAQTFQAGRPVSGAEAIAALDRVDRLWREAER